MKKGKTWDEIQIGDQAELTTEITAERIEEFGRASADRNTIHFDDEAARAAGFDERVAHGVLTLGFCSAVLGTLLPGPGTIAVDLNITFLRPAYVGDMITSTVKVKEKDEKRRTVTMRLIWKNDKGKTVCRGTAKVIPPAS